jgi:hypothetical protein
MLPNVDKNKTSRNLERSRSSNKVGRKHVSEFATAEKAQKFINHKCKLFFFKCFTPVLNSPGRHFPKAYGTKHSRPHSWHLPLALWNCCSWVLVSIPNYTHTQKGINIHTEYMNSWYIRQGLAQLFEALCYKPEGSAFDFRWVQWEFSVT